MWNRNGGECAAPYTLMTVKRTGISVVVVALIPPLIAVFLLRDQIWTQIKKKSLLVADEAELRSTYDRWLEAGKPSGADLTNFMQGRNPRIFIKSANFNLNGSNVQTLLAMTNLSSGESGALIITMSKLLMKQEVNGVIFPVEYPY
jgi:hypothetical protein